MAISVRNARAGFSLMEMMVVIMVIGLLAGMLVPGLNSALKKAKRGTTKSTLSTLKQGINRYKNDLNQYPETLKNLINKPKSGDERVMRKWEGPYVGDEGIENVPEDAWDNKIHYKVTPPPAKHPYELVSYGPDGSKSSPKEEWVDAWVVD